MMEREMI